MMASKITLERLKSLLRYEPETGDFVWLVSKARAIADDIAGTPAEGYILIGIDGKSYRAHRLAWFWMTGEWPHEIDHRDLNRANNRWANLRECTRHQNKANTRAHRDNQTGFKGVSRNRRGYRAEIIAFGVRRSLGTFPSALEAHQVYVAEAQRCFGEFARAA